MTSRRSRRPKSLISLAVIGAALSMSAVAFAEEPRSMSEAKATGDPAASAPAVDAPDAFIYEGVKISEATAGELELACLQTVERYICKDSETEFSGTEGARASRSKARNGASASMACGVVELWLYQHKQYGGWASGVYNYYTWFNLGAERNNETSSYRTGTASAHMSDFADGGGWWYPGATGYCNYHSNILQPFPEWNDRISSRYRF